ncbi:MAG: pyridoxamine 5'-phosphate oxidase family protein [Anaerolineaceae bacterium]|nr:pyridoxamine 5'-phosphate oxidase family protein [Anaerolineaceae bacterium]MBN2677262.1 pyridoxamine 5'-phosphate oxidase family protein [Anaerolineaceae bacterium]
MHRTDAVLTQDWVKEFLARPLLARLGTADPKRNQPHVTPVWFEWDGGCLYISAFISTRKAREVVANPRISVLIDVDKPTQAVLLEGEAEVLTDPAEVAPRALSIYSRYVGQEDVKGDPYQAWVHDPENRIIRLRPNRAFAWRW